MRGLMIRCAKWCKAFLSRSVKSLFYRIRMRFIGIGLHEIAQDQPKTLDKRLFKIAKNRVI